MHLPRTLKIKTYVVLFLMVSVGALGNLLLDKGMKDAGAVDLSSRAAVVKSVLAIMTSGEIWFGVALMLGFMICHMLVLSWADYSFVMPFSAISYAIVPLLGHFFLRETVHPLRWAGIGLIVCGVFLVSRTPPRTGSLRASDLPAEAD